MYIEKVFNLFLRTKLCPSFWRANKLYIFYYEFWSDVTHMQGTIFGSIIGAWNNQEKSISLFLFFFLCTKKLIQSLSCALNICLSSSQVSNH